MFPSFNLRYHRNADETANFPATPLSIPSSKRRDSLFDMDVEIRRDETTPSSLQLLNLPADILLLLSEFLIPASRSSLRLTCRALHNTIPVPSKPLHDDICARTAIYRHIDERQDAASGKHRCALCKALYSDAQYVRARVIDPLFHFTNFAVDQSPSMLKKVDQINIPERDRKGVNASAQDFPSTRICAWHINRFIFPPSEALQPNPAFDKLVTAAAAYGTCPGAVEEEVGKNGWASSIEPGAAILAPAPAIAVACGKSGAGGNWLESGMDPPGTPTSKQPEEDGLCRERTRWIASAGRELCSVPER
ncbi:hypothetical protein ANO11243_052200 [Dothideomycetidae sp. 11243]|nr:hypothetical protein ANO11243_052200 [fungal sp. No.11243]